VVHVPWPEVLRSTVWPQPLWHKDYLTTIVAVLGTTISPYLFFWQASQEVEELRADAGARPLRRAPGQVRQQLRALGWLCTAVMALAVLGMFGSLLLP
jgi:Mn2+/Fe2+ NRAMP family transporter